MTAPGGEALPRPPRWRAIGAVIVVLALFLGMTGVAQRYMADIDGMAHSLAVDAAPSIRHLSHARGELRHMTFEVRDALRAADAGEALQRSRIDEARAAFDAAMSAYLAVAPYAKEAALRRSAVDAVAAYRRSLAALLQAMSQHQPDVAHALVSSSFMPDSDRADHAIEALERFDADYSITTAAKITAARQRATNLSYLVAALAALAVFLIMVIALRASDSFAAVAAERARLAGERKQLAEQRAGELEMFAARVAHDLRNPLSAIDLRASMALRDSEDAATLREGFGRVRHAARHANQIIEALLAFARAGGAPAVGERADVAAAVATVIEDLAAEAGQAQVTLRAPAPLSVEVACAAGALLSILDNLIWNAIKFMGEGGDERTITIRTELRGATARIEVADTGPGIAPDIADRIFEPYVRSSNAKAPGLGLGLATVKRIVEAHRGRVGVDAGVPRGSCFWLELPVATHA